MASDQTFVEYVCEQIRPAGVIRSRKMFGEYLVYCNDKPVLSVCDNTVYVKILDGIASLMADADIGIPYAGCKPHYIVSKIDDQPFLLKLVRAVEPLVPLPKSKRKQ